MRTLAVCFVVAAAACAFGCGSSSDATPAATDTGVAADAPGDTGASDSGPSDATPDAPVDATPPTPAFQCGPPPYVTVAGKIGELALGGTKPKAGVKITVNTCPGKSVTSADDGSFAFAVTKSVPFIGRAAADGELTTLGPEASYDVDVLDAPAVILPSILTAIFPNYGADKPLILGSVIPDPAATGACAKKDGVTFTVAGHAEAKIVYYTNDTIPKADATLTATSASGLAEISGIPSSATPISVTGSKTGCTASNTAQHATGRLALENGAVSPAPIALSN